MIRLFQTVGIDHLFRTVLSKIDIEVEKLNDSRFEKDAQKDTSDYIISKYAIKKLNIVFDKRTSDVTLVPVSGAHFPYNYNVNRNQNHNRARVEYSFPVTSGIELLSVQPKTKYFGLDVDIETYNGGFKFFIQTYYGNIQLSDEVTKQVKSQAKPIIDILPEIQSAINDEIDEFNVNVLHEYIEQKIKERQSAIEKIRKQRDSLNDI